MAVSTVLRSVVTSFRLGSDASWERVMDLKLGSSISVSFVGISDWRWLLEASYVTFSS